MTKKAKNITKRKRANDLAAAIKEHLDLDRCEADVGRDKVCFTMRKEVIEGTLEIPNSALYGEFWTRDPEHARDYLLELSARFWLLTAQTHVNRLMAEMGIQSEKIA